MDGEIFRFEEQFHKLIFTLMFIAMVLVIITAVSEPTEEFKLYLDTVDTMNEGWTDLDTGEGFGDRRVEVEPGGMIRLRRTLPDNLSEDSVIGYYDSGFHVNTYVDGRPIYESGVTNNKVIGYEMGSVWRKIPLSPDMSGRDLTIVLINEMDVSQVVDFGRMYLGTNSDIYLKMIFTGLVPNVIAASLFVIGMALLVFTVILLRAGYRLYFERIRALGILTLLVALWVFTDGHLLQIAVSNASVRYISTYFAFLCIPIWISRFYGKVFDENEAVFRIIIYSYELVLTAILALYVSKTIHISDALFVVYAFIFVEFIFIGYYSLATYRNTKDRYNLSYIVSFAVLLLSFIHGIFQYYLTSKRAVSVYVAAGYLIYIIITFATQVRYIIIYYKAEMKAKDFKQMASVDPVTGGDSSVVVMDFLQNEKMYEKGNPWFLHMDMMGFSNVNISLGWDKGNEIIKGLYSVFKEMLGPAEVVSNIGNGSFVFALNPERNIDSICEKLTKALNNYLDREWGTIVLNVRYAASKIHRGDNFGELLDHSVISFNTKLARYSITSNCYYYDAECQKEAKRQYEIERQIVKAIDDEEFEMYLQPKVDPLNEKVVGAEALIRWNSQNEGLISPGAFVPVAEKSGQIGMLDLYMFKKACQYIRHRYDDGLPMFRVSVNMSRFGIERYDFFDSYERIMEETRVPAEYLEFEITESMALERIDRLVPIIERIHKHGATVSMDDFGSAYSNFATISQLKFDVVKLDKTFFDAGFPENRHQYILVRDLISMFHNMEIEVVCEGIETKEQKDALVELGCDMIQGFYYSRALPAREFNEYGVF